MYNITFLCTQEISFSYPFLIPGTFHIPVLNQTNLLSSLLVQQIRMLPQATPITYRNKINLM
jgi:hypothetical protein